MAEGSSEAPRLPRQWFDRSNLRIVLLRRTGSLTAAGLTLMDAINAHRELGECIEELSKAIDVKVGTDRTEPK
jgi:hypothetical protein